MKTKVLISFAVTAKLICVFVFAYAKSCFSQDVAHLPIIKRQKEADHTVYRHTRPPPTLSVTIAVNADEMGFQKVAHLWHYRATPQYYALSFYTVKPELKLSPYKHLL